MAPTPHPRDVPVAVAQLREDVDRIAAAVFADDFDVDTVGLDGVDDPTVADEPAWLTADVDTLAGRDYTRDQLDAIAAELGVTDPDGLDNKAAVAAAIVEARQ